MVKDFENTCKRRDTRTNMVGDSSVLQPEGTYTTKNVNLYRVRSYDFKHEYPTILFITEVKNLHTENSSHRKYRWNIISTI